MLFQFTLPRGERRHNDILVCPACGFQSTLPQGERPYPGHSLTAILNNFNPRSHKGSDYHSHGGNWDDWKISIHAPTRGATYLDPEAAHDRTISIHAPTRGATCWFQDPASECRFQSTLPQGERRFFHGGICPVCDFNPRSHKGSDGEDQHRRPPGYISIHAPTRGATFVGGANDWDANISIHAPTRGATPASQTLPKTRTDFNPRSHKGSDRGGQFYNIGGDTISIHAPTRGATSLYFPKTVNL